MAAADSPLDVVFIAGWSYSGSTLLGNMLGELDGFLSVGELRYVWRHGVLENRLCGCGSPFASCSLWSAIARDHLACLPAPRLAKLEERLLQTRALPELALARHGRGRLVREVAEYRRALEILYRGIRLSSGCGVVVDTTKAPTYAYLLEGLPGVRLTVVHLVRDPRGTAFSYRRRESSMSLARSMALWNAWHALTELLWRGSDRYLRIRYEDLMRDPGAGIAAAAGLVGHDGNGLRLDGDVVLLRPNHNISGNRSRLRNGRVELKLDDEWRLHLPSRQRMLASTLTWPLRLRYGYRGAR